MSLLFPAAGSVAAGVYLKVCVIFADKPRFSWAKDSAREIFFYPSRTDMIFSALGATLLSLLKITLEQPSQFPQRFLSSALHLRDTTCELGLFFPHLPVDHSMVFSLAQLAQYGTHSSLRIFGIGNHVSHDHFDTDTFVGGVPAVVVGRHAHERIRNLSFAEKRRFGVCRHVDDATGERRGAIEDRLGPGGELRPFCVQGINASIHGEVLERDGTFFPHFCTAVLEEHEQRVGALTDADHCAIFMQLDTFTL